MDTDAIVSAIDSLADKFHDSLVDQKRLYAGVLELLKSIDGRLAAIELCSDQTSQGIQDMKRMELERR